MRRTLAALLVGAVAAALTAVPVVPAAATTGTAISIKVDETKLIHGDAIVGMSTQFQANNHPDWVPLGQVTTSQPSDCESEPIGCVVIPINLDIPEDDPDLIESQAYLLNVVVSYDEGQRVDTTQVGAIRQNDLESFLYQDPQVRNSSGTATYTSASHQSNPAQLVAVAPTSKKFKLVLANYFGVNNGYTLQISLIKSSSIEFHPGPVGHDDPDYVQPTFTPPSDTPPPSTGGGEITGNPGNQPPPPSISGSEPIVVPNIAAGKADQQLLAMSKILTPSKLGLHAVKVTSTVAQVKAGSSSHTKLVLGLAVLPVVLLAAGLVLVLRRRKGAAPAL